MKKEEVTHTRVKLYKSGKHWVSSVIALTLPLVLYSSQTVLAEEAGQVTPDTVTLTEEVEPVLEPNSTEETTPITTEEVEVGTEEETPTETEAEPTIQPRNAVVQDADSQPAAEPSQTDANQKEESQDTSSLEDIGKNTDKREHFKPQDHKIPINKILDWTPPTGVYDEIAKASVLLENRVQGHQTNPLANPEVKVQSLAYLSSKAKGHSAVGGGDQGLGIYAFDYWQYVDSMVYWDGLVPNPDVIDAAHRNGVPIYGTIFYNWSTSEADRDIVRYTLQEDSENSGTFPVARKLVEIAKHYGFEGYFINQETSMPGAQGYSEKFREFLHYAKNYAKTQNQRFDIAWYDAMSSYGSRYHSDAVDAYNSFFMEKNQEGNVAINDFFVNFNWRKPHVDTTVATMQALGRNPYDAYLGLELQQGGAYKTHIKKDALLDENGKPRLSLGLFVPDTIMGLAKDGEDYHEHENHFWTGPNGDPTKSNDDVNWSGISRFAVEKTPILGENFTSNFNTGHGRQWFVDGEASLKNEWNSRSVQDVMPTWRWWIQNENSDVKGKYDFTQAYNGGTSLKFEGSQNANAKSKVMLYASQLDIKKDSVLKVAAKANTNQNAKIGLATSEDYAEENTVYFDIAANENWELQAQSLAQLAGKTVYGISLLLESQQANSDLQFNLGQISISRQDQTLATPNNLKVEKSLRHSAQKAEAIVSYDKVADAAYYEIYQEVDGKWEIVNATSSNIAYLPKLVRANTDKGTLQNIKVVAVGKDGKRSEAGMGQFDWMLEANDTTPAKAKAENIVPGSTITSANAAGNAESAENILTGTINNTADKWYSGNRKDHVDIRLDKPRTVVRWVVDHAGAGGEAVDDGSMNTKAFDLQYKDMATGEWKVAHSITNNKAHVTDVTLDTPITALEWRLNVTDPDNGTPWGGIRIYNWKMYESLDTETDNIPMNKASISHISEDSYLAKFAEVPKDTTVTLYADKDATQAIGSGKVDQDGNLIISNVSLKDPKGVVYYRAQAVGKEASNILALNYSRSPRVIEAISLLTKDGFKSEYEKGENLDLTDAFLEISTRYGNDVKTEMIPLTNDLVKVENLQSDQSGRQKLTVYFNGQAIDDTLDVTVSSDDDEATPAKPVSMTIKNKGKSHYQKGQDLDLTDATFEVVYDNGKTELVNFSDQFTVEGYDPLQVGNQTLTIKYLDLEASTQISIEALNYQPVDQAETILRSLFEDPRFKYLPEDKQEHFQYMASQVGLYKTMPATLQRDLTQLAQELNSSTEELTNLLAAIQIPQEKKTDKGEGATMPTLPEFPRDQLKRTDKADSTTMPLLPEFSRDQLKRTDKGEGATMPTLPEFSRDQLKRTDKADSTTMPLLPEFSRDQLKRTDKADSTTMPLLPEFSRDQLKRTDKADSTTMPLLPEFPRDQLKRTDKADSTTMPLLPQFPTDKLKSQESKSEKPKVEVPKDETPKSDNPSQDTQTSNPTQPQEDSSKIENTSSSSDDMLPNTGENLTHIFYPATLAILAGLGLVVSNKKGKED